jgi:hypothetical protein
LALFIAMLTTDKGSEKMNKLMTDNQKMTELYRKFREIMKTDTSERSAVVTLVNTLCNAKIDTKNFRQMCFMHMWSAQMLEDANRWRVGRATRQAKAGEKTDVVFCNT